MSYRFLIISFFIFLGKNVTWAQLGTRGTTTNNTPTDTTKQNIGFQEEAPDTAKVLYFYAANPAVNYILADTTLDNHFQQYLPTRTRYDEYAYLGYAGSPARAVVRPTYERMGFDIGFHQFDIYKFENHHFRYFNTRKSFSQGKWSFRAMGNDSNLDFEYGGHFKKNVFVSLNWHRINTSSDGAYKLINQSAINSNWGLSIGQLQQRYEWFLSFTSNGFQQNDNGGIISDAALRNADTTLIGGKQSITPQLSGALSTTYTTRDIQWQHALRLNANEAAKYNFRVVHQINYRATRYKAYNKFGTTRSTIQKTNDSLFIGDLSTDERGVRFFTKVRNIDNKIFLSAFAKNQHQTIGSKGNNFETGIRHQLFYVDNEKNTTVVNNLFAFGKVEFNNIKAFQLNTYAHFGIAAANIGEYKVEGNLALNMGIAGKLEGQLMQQRIQPTLVQRQLYNVQKELWNNDFNKVLETSFSGKYSLAKIGFSAEMVYQLLNNYIYYTTYSRPIQQSSPINVFQIKLSENYRLKHFGVENFISFQKSSDAAIHLPSLTGKHGIFAEGKLFRKKVMLARIGLDLRYTTEYKADAYNPLTGQFYWQDTYTMPFYPAVDAYISARVDKTRIFIKIENATKWLSPTKVFYTVPYYPMYDTYLRVGLHRRFTD